MDPTAYAERPNDFRIAAGGFSECHARRSAGGGEFRGHRRLYFREHSDHEQDQNAHRGEQAEPRIEYKKQKQEKRHPGEIEQRGGAKA